MNQKNIKVLEFNKIVDKMLELSSSELGKELINSINIEKDYLTVKNILKETSDGVECIIRKGNPPLSGIYDIRPYLKRVSIGAVLNPKELLKIASMLTVSRKLKNYASELESLRDNIVLDLIKQLNSHKIIESKILNAIISEDEISDNASSTLRNIRRQIQNNQASIKEKLNNIIKSSKYQKYIQEAIVTMRGDRYVVPVKQEHRNEIPGFIHDASASGATIFIEPMAVVEANNAIKKLKIDEDIEIQRILKELTEDVSSINIELETNVHLAGKIDFIFAKSKLSLKYNCMCPTLNNDKRIVIKKGRHPLINADEVVPIDFWIGDEFSTLVVTGPNTGGKTVTLKTVGLFTMMAQAGLHIPASDGTEIGIFQNIFADIGDEQSIEQSLSTFSSHMKNIVNIMDNVCEDSLVLFDELGAGTDPREGAALGISILEYLRSRNIRTIATTHYSELKVYAISRERVENASCEFNVQTLRPTYKILIGIPGKSNAFSISQRLGLNSDIIDKAKEVLTKDDIKFEDIVLKIEKNLKETEEEKQKAEKYKKEIEVLKKELEKQNEKLNEKRDKILKKAKEEAKKVLAEAKEEAEKAMEQIKKAQEEKYSQDSLKDSERVRIQLKKKVENIEESLISPIQVRRVQLKPPKNLKPGETVLIHTLNQKGSVLKAPDKNGDVLVQVGIMKVNVHISTLKRIDDEENQTAKHKAMKFSAPKSKSVAMEVDVRGQNLDEAIENVDKYLDDASITGLTEVTIIHGKGTGVLRTGIQRHLRTNFHVKSFRSGRYGEGEQGVTIVELK